jgi:hypothetical protein
MNAADHNLTVHTPKLAIMQTPSQMRFLRRPNWASLRLHWPKYLMEAGLLGAFMVSARGLHKLPGHKPTL